jgi:hypothetical protein
MFDPSALSKVSDSLKLKMGVGDQAQNIYPSDTSFYLWELFYPNVFWPKDENIPWTGMATPQRYMGYVEGLTLSQTAVPGGYEGSQTDLRWNLVFQVLQRRDYFSSGI